jgi:hypothetical protein
MSNEEKVKRLERLVAEKTSAAKDLKFVFAAEGSVAEFTADAAVLREAAQVMRELGALLTSPDWKTMYEAQERDMAEMRKRIAELEAERDAARAGEARAVEALEAEQRAALWRNLARITDKHEDALEAGRLSEIAQRLRHGIVLVLTNNQPAIDWLAQREREAAARELRLLADGCATVNPVLSWQLRACADGLTDQQPTACSRSEVRGKERL